MIKLDIKVIGSGCTDCDKLFENVKAAVKSLGIDAEITRVEDLREILMLGVMSAPSLMVDDKLVISGCVASVEQVKKKLKV